MEDKYTVVMMGVLSKHVYILGNYGQLTVATVEADKEENERAGKYVSSIWKGDKIVDGFNDITSVKLAGRLDKYGRLIKAKNKTEAIN